MESLHQPEDIINQRYRIVTPLGQGSMGTTYEAEDLTNDRRVAIKAVSLRQATEWKILELFEREARVLANLNHPNIPNYLDYFYVDSEGDRIFYLVRELVRGDSLANLVKRGFNLEEERVKEIAVQVLQTLDYLHRLNPSIIHRDIKPENLIVDRLGKVFVVDFGAVQDVYRQTISLSHTFVGTLGYMAPEQFRGQIKPASDLYSFGATLVFILTGRSPVDLPQVRMKIDFKNRVSISPQFADWLDKILEPMLEDRFTSAREALNALKDKTVSRRNRLIESDRSIPNIMSTRRQQLPEGTKIETFHQPNEILNQRYRIVDLLSQGSIDTTYEAQDLTSYQRVAIKSLSLGGLPNRKTLELLEREALVLRSLNHRGIPPYIDYFQQRSKSDRRFYLVQKLVEGKSLATLVENNWKPDEYTLKNIAIKVLKILEDLASFYPPVIHRNINPQNIIRHQDGRVYLVNFGAVQDVYRNTISGGETFVGTLDYMAPEQLDGNLIPASDLYGLGASLVFVLTGRSPVDLPKTQMKIDFRNSVSISPQFADWLDKMLEPMLEDRFTSARLALNALNDETSLMIKRILQRKWR